MNATMRISGAAAAVAALAALAGCAGMAERSNDHSSITYQASAQSGVIDEIQYQLIDGPSGLIVLSEGVNEATWEAANVDGGSAPEITVVPDGKTTIARCVIIDADSGDVLDEADGDPGQPVTCKVAAER